MRPRAWEVAEEPQRASADVVVVDTCTWAVEEGRHIQPVAVDSPGCSPVGSPAVDSSRPGCCIPGCSFPAADSPVVGSPGRNILRFLAGCRRRVGVLLVPVLEKLVMECDIPSWILTPYLSLMTVGIF